MEYDPRRNDHGLPRDPFKSLVAPRPIGWISSVNREGVTNLAPYSFFNALCDHPHLVMFASLDRKDSQANAEDTGEFVCNLATYALRDAMNRSSAPAPHGVSEFDLAGLEAAPSRKVTPPRVAASPVALECVYLQTIAPRDVDGEKARYEVVIGQVVHIHIDDNLIVDGFVDLTKAEPIARCGYMQYAHVTSLFELDRPTKV
ncbi:MAG: flavin reductase family protein [Pseudomonadota bacterium]